MTDRPKPSRIEYATFVLALIACVFVWYDLWWSWQMAEQLERTVENLHSIR